MCERVSVIGMHPIPLGVRRVAALLVGYAIVGVGVGLVLDARLGSDGYSTAIYGISKAAEVPYAFVNWGLGAALVLGAWLRGIRPGLGTPVHPIIVGATVDFVLLPGSPPSTATRIALLAVGAVVLAVGVAIYLGAALGAGPFESLALALHPVQFRTAYVFLQALGTIVGCSLGAPAGPWTLLIVFGIGPLVAALRRRLGPRAEER